MSQVTLLDIAKLTGNDAVVGLIEENIKSAPEMSVIPARTVKGTSYHTGVRTGRPSAGFRSANDGVTPSKSTFDRRLVECFILSSQIIADKAVADAYEDGADAWKSIEASGVMESVMRAIGSQVFYGTAADGKGFPGLKAFLPFGGATSAGDALTINAAGSTATSASSVYAVKFGPQAVQLVFGANQSLALGDWRIQSIAGATAGTYFDAYVNALTGWAGLQMGNENCARRIANLTADSGKGLTDALLAQLLATFPVGVRPDAIFMSRRSRGQLQASRTVVLNGSGKVRPDQPTIAPTPTSFEEIPIIATDSILNNDAIESA